MNKDKLDEVVSTFLFMSELSQAYLIPMLSAKGNILNKSQINVLRELRANGRMNLSYLAEKVSLTNQALTTISNTLVTNGFARRIYDDNNRRQIELELTPQGLKFVNDNEDEVVEIVGQVFSVLSDDDLEKLRLASDEIYEVLDKTAFGEKYGKKKEYEKVRRLRYRELKA